VDRQIVPMLLEALVNGLQVFMIDQLDPADPTRIDEIKIGRYQSEPTTKSLRLAVLAGDLDDPEWKDEIVRVDSERQSVMGFSLPQREIGGTQMWWRKGTVRLELFYIFRGANEDDSREWSYAILGRLQDKIEEVQVYSLSDDFNERAVKVFSTSSMMYQSGGAPSSFIFRGKVYWQCLTERAWD
jgi:hypothetical protein